MARRLMTYLAVMLVVSFLLASCSGPEKKKMKFYDKGQALFEQ